jgi:hypothetical protein
MPQAIAFEGFSSILTGISMPEAFPDRIRVFVEENLNSVEQLEVLLLLRQDAEKKWTAESVSQAIYTPVAAASKRLVDLVLRRLAVADESQLNFSYHPASSELEQLVDELATVYRDRRVAVISLIYSKPNDHVQAFADAFKFRKEKG